MQHEKDDDTALAQMDVAEDGVAWFRLACKMTFAGASVC